MRIKRYLVIQAKSNEYHLGKATTRLTTNKPSTNSDEIYVQLDIEVPDALFKKPQLVSKIVITEDQCASRTIDADTVTQLENLASETLGVELSISVSNDSSPLMSKSEVEK